MRQLSICLLAALWLAPWAPAEVVYSTIGPLDDYNPSMGWNVGFDPQQNGVFDIAVPFTPSRSGILDSIELPLSMVGGGGVASVLVEVFADPGSPGLTPAGPVISARYDGPVAAKPSVPLAPLITVDFPDTFVLTEGQGYWVVLSDVTSTSANQLTWNNSELLADGVAGRRNAAGGSWWILSFVYPGALRVHALGGFGGNVCGPLIPNSTGLAGGMVAVGSSTAVDNELTLVATRLPLFAFGMFMASTERGSFPTALATSNGTLCLDGTVGRFNAPGQLMGTGPVGALTLTVDLGSIPQGGALVSASAGETWVFQAWHRDVVGLGSNFSDAVEVTFQ